MLACVVLLDLDEILLRMGTNLNDILCAYMPLNLLPRTSVFLQGVKKELVLLVGPVLSVFCYDVLLAGLLRRRGRRRGVLTFL